MTFPIVVHSFVQERRGIAAVQSYAARHGQIFRETPTGDVGVDAQLEFVRADRAATGRTLALQVKSGPSFFEHETAEGWKYYPEEKHRAYWEQYPLPVILVLHSPDTGHSYWLDARQALRIDSSAKKAFLEVPKANLLESTPLATLFANAGVQSEAFIDDLDLVVEALRCKRTSNALFPLSFLDLFCGGLTNICRSIYFGVDVALVVVQSNLDMCEARLGYGMGGPEHDFLFDFVRFLVAQNLADVNFADCLIDVEVRAMTPQFVAPLTSRGRALVELLQAKEEELVKAGKMPDGHGERVAQEVFFAVDDQSYGDRLSRLFQFQAALL